MPAEDPSFFEWLYLQLGIKYAFLLPLSMVIACVVLRVVARKSGNAKVAWIVQLFVAPFPLFLGIFGTLEAYRTVNAVLGASMRTATAEEVQVLHHAAWATTWVGAVLSLPPIALAAYGVWRSRRRGNSNVENVTGIEPNREEAR